MNIQRRFLLLFLLVGVPAFAEEKVAQEQFAQTQLDQDQAGTLTLEAAIAQAIGSDPWLNGSRYREDTLASESISASTLPDPKVSLMAANFPTDSFDINQEPMTQLTVGVSQMFPRGDSLALTSRQKQELAAQEAAMGSPASIWRRELGRSCPCVWGRKSRRERRGRSGRTWGSRAWSSAHGTAPSPRPGSAPSTPGAWPG